MSEAVIEIRTYRLKPGSRETFDGLFQLEALPMLVRDGIRVIGSGESLIDDVHYLLARWFPSIERRAEQLDAFYGSPEWLERMDARVMACIESFHTVVLPTEADPATHAAAFAVRVRDR